MGAGITVDVLKQHLIDPEICIRCNTCEETCPSDAITHDSRNYVVDAAKCNACLACIGPCPTGAIDNWRIVARAAAHGVDAQLGWDVLPAGGRGRRGYRPALRARLRLRTRRRRRRQRFASTTLPARRSRRAAPRIRTSISTLDARAADGDRRRQLPRHRGHGAERHAAHRARLRRDGVSGARRPVDRHRAAGRRRRRPAAFRAPVFGGEPARRRACRLQQPVADGEARHRRPRRQAGARRVLATTCATSPRAMSCR